MLHDWLLLIIPVASYFITQGAKLAFDGIKGNLDIYHMWTKYGGMPSAHSAFVVSLSAYLGLTQGFDSPFFAIAIVFTIITIRDAIGIRQEIGRQGTNINALVQKLPEKDQKEFNTLSEHMGHTILEVFVGSVFGLTIALLGYHFL
ncbi:MAG: divergent PAP2 family protein [Patescibacteria group bacterium]|jgi:hypothetical protein